MLAVQLLVVLAGPVSTCRFSNGGTKSVLHTDSLENMHCLVAGQKEFILIPPQYAKVIGPEWANQGYFDMDVEQVNMTAYPGLADVPWYKTVLQQGDCLYLPYLWIHHVSGWGSTAVGVKRVIVVHVLYAV